MAIREVATLGGGCFWCIEAVFEQLQGVHKVESGYSGGNVRDPSYELVCAGKTGHAEVVQVTFDPAAIPYKAILEVFFSVHDPTTKDRQGNDVGTQYRSVVFHHSEAQKTTAAAVIKAIDAEKVYDEPIVTELVPFDAFYVAESVHQGYYERNPVQPYCMFVVRPKVSKFRKKWAHLLKENA